MAARAPPSGVRSAVRKLCLYGADALKPRYVNDRWRGAAVSAREAARIRKEALESGTYGSFDPTTGKGWEPSWDKPGRISALRAPKETKRERTREERAQKIEVLMAGMDERIGAYRQAMVDRKPDKSQLAELKRMLKKGKKGR